MPVFNAAESQVLFKPVTSYKQGQAFRANMEQAEVTLESTKLQNKALKQEIAGSPARMKLAAEKAALERDRLVQQIETEGVELSSKELELRKEAYGGTLEYVAAQMEAGEPVDMDKVNKGIRDGVRTIGGDEEKNFLEFAGKDRQLDEDELTRFANVYSIRQEAGTATSHQKNINALVEAGHISREEGNQLIENIEIKAGTITGTTEHDPSALAGGADDNVQARQIREVIGSAENLVDALDRTLQLVNEAPQAALGLPGSASGAIDQAVSAMTGFAEIAGGWAEINGEEVPEARLLDERLYAGIEGFSGMNAAIKANAIGVSYALARAANPDGRISDADVRHQLERLQLGSSSKTRIRAGVKEVRRTTLQSAMNWVKATGGTKTTEGREAYSKFQTALEEMDKMETFEKRLGAARETPGEIRSNVATGEIQRKNADGEWVDVP